MLKQHLKIKPTKIGNGLFTDVKIPANFPIIEVGGTVCNWESIQDKENPYIMEIGNNLFITSSGDLDDYVNHSCNPNCVMHIIGKRAILYSLYIIPADSELTFDYSLTSTDSLDSWKMDCLCGNFNCRKVISGFHLLPDDLKKNYMDNDLVPQFIRNPIFMKK